ncbi:MAG: hypothetical protein Q8L81_18185 [Bacteroidota bacterium]|nr:hypothetical protein [Bacteroidota bacterium]
MKALIIFLILPIFLSITSNDKLDSDNGFGNYKFGTSPQQYKDLTIEIEEGTSKLFSSSSQINTNVNGVEFEYIRVTFCSDKLSAISLQTKHNTSAKFFQFLQENYGRPNKVKENHEWLGKNVRLVYEQINTKDAVISFYNRQIYEQGKKTKK